MPVYLKVPETSSKPLEYSWAMIDVDKAQHVFFPVTNFII